MKQTGLEAMPLDDLWELHEKIIALLDFKLSAEKHELEKRLEGLAGTLGESTRHIPHIPRRRPYPKVFPKYRNPMQPSEAWSGRGRQPHWVRDLLAKGKSLDDLRISARKR